MTAVQIINAIKHLPSGERARVVQFVRTLDDKHLLTGQELNELAEKLVVESHPVKAEALKDQIAMGFYGGKQDA